jgi:hypothetical protein
MVVHAKISVYNISINQRSKSDIYHQNNQPIFLNRENIFVLGSLSLKKIIAVGFQGVKSILSQSREGKINQSRKAKDETRSRFALIPLLSHPGFKEQSRVHLIHAPRRQHIS